MKNVFLIGLLLFFAFIATSVSGQELYIQSEYVNADIYDGRSSYFDPYNSSGTMSGFVDESGYWVIEPRYTAVVDFSEGLAAVKQRGKWGFIDRTGKVVIEPIYNDIEDFIDGFARIELDGKWGYVYRTGEVVVEPK